MVTAKTGILLGGAGLALIGGAWAFTGRSDEAEIDQQRLDPGTVLGSEIDTLEDSISSSTDRFDKDVQEKTRDLLLVNFLEHDGPNQEKRVEGKIYLGSQYARTYNNPYSTVFYQQSGPTSVSEIAVARSEDPKREPVLLANDSYEVIVDYATNKRYVIDHEREIIQEEPLVAGGVQANAVLNDARSKDPQAAKRLEGLFGQFNKPRLDPKRQFKLTSPTGAGKTVTLNQVAVDCSYQEFTMSGGKVGEACYADINAVPGLDAVRARLMQYPLPGANRNDALSRIRQLAEIGGAGRFPVSFKIKHSGLDDDDYDVDLTGFNRRDLDPDAFEPPKGYRLRTMGPQ